MTTFVAKPVTVEAEEPGVATVRIDQLVTAAFSPRHGPPDATHVRALREIIDLVPPILVHRPTMAVIDGAHRLAAARAAGRSDIRVTFFDGDAAAAFILAIQANSTHGRPLSVSERKGAARRVLDQQPDRSTRWIASVCGLAPSTVEVLRAPAHSPQQRVGRDGRSRPADRRATQAAIAERLEAEPGASARQIAADLGVSPATVRRVARQQSESRAEADVGGWPTPSRPTLLPDPFTRWLSATQVAEENGVELVDQLPRSQAAATAGELRRRSQFWAALADRVDRLAAPQ